MPKIHPEDIKQLAVSYRQKGYTYTEIQHLLNYPIPKTTFTGWFKQIQLSEESRKRIIEKMSQAGKKGRAQAWNTFHQKRQILLTDIHARVNQEISSLQFNNTTEKIILAMLYLAEGGKTQEYIRFANSDPKIIQLFLRIFRKCFQVDENKLRGRVLCRADQNIEELEQFWSNKTGIPTNQFHKESVDKRTIGKDTLRSDYKGVFVVIYSSVPIFLELKYMAEALFGRV